MGKKTNSILESEIPEKIKALIDNIEKVIIGKREVIINAITALFAEGHILIEDVPGVGKTMLAKAIAKSISGEFKRVQFTADLLPSDISGVTIYQQESGQFNFRKGPIFTNVLLGDEINRATPRTQSSLLEAMEEKQVTVDGKRHQLELPFFVIATQNPIELEGTYPLPFAQMDRFITRLNIGYISANEEKNMLKSRINSSPIENCTSVINCEDLVKIQHHVQLIKINDDLLDYIVEIVRKTRSSPAFEYGASPRGTLDLMRFSQSAAMINNRDYVLPDDIKRSAGAVLAHRVVVKKGTRHASLNMQAVIDEVINSIEVPV